tara:strand:+ start:81 stop:914 length:834 start_codon:yes stop_codon:yes gene_type:complete
MKDLIRRILREETDRMPLRHIQLSNSVNDPLDVSGESGDTISGKEINNSLTDGVLYHCSHNPNLNKSNIRLFSKGSDMGNAVIGDRYGLYLSPDFNYSSEYLWTWVLADDKMRNQGQSIFNEMEPNTKEEIFNLINNIHISYGNKEDKESLTPEDFATIAGVYNGLWPTIYKITLKDDSRFIPITDLDITHDDYAKYTQLNKVKGIGGIYVGELSRKDWNKHNEIAILNRNAIQSMNKVGDSEFWNFMSKIKGFMGDENYMIKHKQLFLRLKSIFGK